MCLIMYLITHEVNSSPKVKKNSGWWQFLCFVSLFMTEDDEFVKTLVLTWSVEYLASVVSLRTACKSSLLLCSPARDWLAACCKLWILRKISITIKLCSKYIYIMQDCMMYLQVNLRVCLQSCNPLFHLLFGSLEGRISDLHLKQNHCPAPS